MPAKRQINLVGNTANGIDAFAWTGAIMSVDFKYRGFISYSYKDKDWGVWLHKALEKYPIHKKLVGVETAIGKTPKRLGRIFRDEDELGSVHDLGKKVETALKGSDTLIVICSPNSANSEWVNNEINYFKSLNRTTRVLALIVDGTPHSGDPETECFPEALKSNPVGSPANPLAVDVRKYGKDDSVIRLVSGILEIDYDDLKQRDEQRRREDLRKAQALFAGGLVLLASALGAGYLALQGFATLAHKNSDIIAREAKAIFENVGQGDMTTSLLMALQADPLANRDPVRRHFAPKTGYAIALARMVGAQTHNRMSLVLKGHLRKVTSVAYAPGGKTLITGSEDGHTIIWDASTGEALTLLKSDIGPVTSVAYAPDGKTLATGFERWDTGTYHGVNTSNVVIIWDAKTGKRLTELKGHIGPVTSVAYAPDGKTLVTGSRDNTAIIWDAKTGVALTTLTGHTNAVYSVSYAPDGKTLVTGSRDETAIIWDAKTGKALTTLTGHTRDIRSVAYAPDSKTLVTGSSDNTAIIWDAKTGKALTTLEGHIRDVNSVSYAPDGKTLATGAGSRFGSSPGDIAIIWDAKTGKALATLKGHAEGVNSVAYSPDGKRLVTGSDDKLAKIWDASTGRALTTLKGHTEGVNSVAYSPDGKRLLTGSDDKLAKIWDTSTGEALTSLTGHRAHVKSVSYAPDGQTLVTTDGWDDTAVIWDANTGEALTILTKQTAFFERSFSSVAYAPDGKTLVAGSDRYAVIWDTKTGGEPLTRLKVTHSGPVHNDEVTSVAYAPDGKTLVTGSMDRTAIIWDVRTEEALTTLKGHINDVISVSYAPDGQTLVTGSGDRTAIIWDAKTGEALTKLTGHTGSFWSVAYAPDGKTLVTGSTDDTAIIWDVRTGEALNTLIGHKGDVRSVVYSPDGKTLVTGSGDDTVKIWNVPEIILAKPTEQVRIACETLWKANAPLNFTAADVAVYPVLKGEPIDPETGDLISPCKGVLPDEAFVTQQLVVRPWRG